MVEQIGVTENVMVQVTRAQAPVDDWFLAIVFLAVVVLAIFIYYKIKN